MGIAIPRIYQRKGSQNWWAKRETPSDIWRQRERLQELGIAVRKVNWKSMGTPSKRDALAKHAAFYAEMSAQFEVWRKVLLYGPATLGERQQWAIAAAITDGLLKSHEATSASPIEWTEGGWRKLLGLSNEEQLIKRIFGLIDTESRKHNLILSQETRLAIGNKLVGYDPVTAQREAARVEAGYKPQTIAWPDDGDLRKAVKALSHRASTGDYSKPAFLASRPELQQALASTKGLSFTFTGLIDNWVSHGRGNVKPSPASVRKYLSQAMAFKRFIGHDDPAMVTPQDAQRYLEHVSKTKDDGSKPAPKQVWGIISNLSTLYAKAVKAEKLSLNPFINVIPPKSGRGEQPHRRGFTDTEAAIVLKAARLEQDTWRRWGPWIMAYTGMRLTEVSQLRKVDIEVEGSSRAFIHVRHEAGHVKSGTNRIIPIHAALRKEGFLKFAESIKGERLFPHVCLDGSGNRNNAKGQPNDSKAHKLSQWVWTTGIKRDPALSPNHAWRHRFEVVALKADLQQIAIDRVIGHTDNHVRSTYQQDDLRDVLVKAMAKFPTLKVG